MNMGAGPGAVEGGIECRQITALQDLGVSGG